MDADLGQDDAPPDDTAEGASPLGEHEDLEDSGEREARASEELDLELDDEELDQDQGVDVISREERIAEDLIEEVEMEAPLDDDIEEEETEESPFSDIDEEDVPPKGEEVEEGWVLGTRCRSQVAGVFRNSCR